MRVCSVEWEATVWHLWAQDVSQDDVNMPTFLAVGALLDQDPEDKQLPESAILSPSACEDAARQSEEIARSEQDLYSYILLHTCTRSTPPFRPDQRGWDSSY
jgi:hypothetical protein